MSALAGRIVAALLWTKYIDQSTDDSRWIGERYDELKRTLSFDEARRRAAAEWVDRVLAEAGHVASAAGEGEPCDRP